jgi:hypothetical protein
MDIHAIAPVGRPDDILHQRASEAGLFRAFIEVFAVAIEMPWADNARLGEWVLDTVPLRTEAAAPLLQDATRPLSLPNELSALTFQPMFS